MIWIWTGVIVLAFVTWRFQRRAYFLQYLFFLRYPLLLGFALAILLPLGSRSGSLIENLFVLENAGWMIPLGFIALLSAWVLMYTLGLMWTRTSIRVSLMFWDADEATARASGKWFENPVPAWLQGGRGMAAFGAFAVPVIVTCIYRSAFGSVAVVRYGACAVLGLAAAVALVLMTFRYVGGRSGVQDIADVLGTLPDFIDRRFFGSKGQTGYEPGGTFKHGNAVLFFLLTVVIYAFGYWLLQPTIVSSVLRDEFPSLAYLLLLLVLLAWILPLLSFEFDKYRIPAEAVLILAVMAVYWMFGTDHYYAELDLGRKADKSWYGAHDVAQGWKDRHSRLPMIIVTASGGGITAAYWTATVLAHLQDELAPNGDGESFASAVRLVSSVSGGSVGAMYFVDAYHDGFAPQRPDLRAIRENAGETSLSSAVWGLIYPDFLRVVLPFMPFEHDRGWAMETRWAQRLRDKDQTTLSRWRDGALAGWQPVVIFNATLVESGERLSIATLDLHSDDTPAISPGLGRRFADMYPRLDLEVPTAARLSATFPWITPVSRPRAVNAATRADVAEAAKDLYHVADGGYYDNYGVVSAVEFLQQVLPHMHDRKVLLIQIRAFDPSPTAPALIDAGFRLETIGPAETMLAVRGASQFARNNLDVQLLEQAVKGIPASTIEIKTADFTLARKSPLSWHLSTREKARICCSWREKDNQDAADTVAAFTGLTRRPASPEMACPLPCELPADSGGG
jgi:hypothetical protein